MTELRFPRPPLLRDTYEPPLDIARRADAFWALVDRTAEGHHPCQTWLGRRHNDGCGIFSHHGENVRAHRFSYVLMIGMIVPSMVVERSCRALLCVAPWHLAIRVPEARPPSHLTAENVDDICWRMRERWSSPQAIAEMYGCTVRYVYALAESDRVDRLARGLALPS